MLIPIKNTKIYEQVINRIKGLIADGTLDIGDQLPTERFLAEQLHVSRTSIREALRAMEIIGLIECRQGEGNFVKGSSENSLIEPMSVMFMLQKYNPYQITEFRKIIEVGTIAQTAQRITDEELEKVAYILNKLNNITDEEDGAEIDKHFHYEIIKCSKNDLIISVYNAVSQHIDTYIRDARIKISEETSNKDVLANQHENIYLALKNHDSKKAVDAMTMHLNFTSMYMSE